MKLRTKKATVLSAIALTVGLMGGLTACDHNNKGTGDSPVATINGHKGGDDSPADVTNFPDHFANIATKCVHGSPGFRAFVSTREAAPVILPDASCK